MHVLPTGWTILSPIYQGALISLHLFWNTALRVQTGTSRRDHISSVLVSLHWLHVKSRIEFKVLLPI